MKKIVVLCCIVCWCFASFGNENDKGLIFKKEIKSFIDSVRKRSGEKLNYSVFYVRIVDSSPSSDLCFSISYIMNYYDLKYIAYDSYIIVDSNYVLIKNGEYAESTIKKQDIKKLDSACNSFLTGKLYSEKGGIISYNPAGAAVCIDKGTVKKRFYTNADDLPAQFSIFTMPEGVIIEKIYDPETQDIK